MTAPTFELQQAVFAALKNDVGMITLMGADPAIYDKVPDDVIKAYSQGAGGTYVTIGEGTESFTQGDFMLEITEHKFHVVVWSQNIGAPEAKKIAYAARSALAAALPEGTSLGSNIIDVLTPLTVQTERAPDGVTTRALLVMRALTSPAN